MENEAVQELLKTTIQSANKSSSSYPKRIKNIEWVMTLPREGLAYQEKEKQIIFKVFPSQEQLCLQYPGKESVPASDKPRPWDFRPKLFSVTEQTSQNDLSFTDLWEDLDKQLENTKSKSAWRTLSILLYRMAFMVDHALDENTRQYQVKYIQNEEVITETSEELNELYRYNPPVEAIKFITPSIPKICNMDLKVFLHYLELITWNEDCKYYYPGYEKARDNPRRNGQPRIPPWINQTGRVNTLLTIINFISFFFSLLQYRV